MMRLLNDTRPPRKPAEVTPQPPRRLVPWASYGARNARGKPMLPEALWGFIRVDDRPRTEREGGAEVLRMRAEAISAHFAEVMRTRMARALFLIRHSAQGECDAARTEAYRNAKEKVYRERAAVDLARVAAAAAEKLRVEAEAAGWHFVEGLPVFARKRGKAEAVAVPARRGRVHELPETEEPAPETAFEALARSAATHGVPAVEVEPTAEELIASHGLPCVEVAPRIDVVLPGEGRWRELHEELASVKARGDVKAIRSIAGKLGRHVKDHPALKGMKP